MPIPKKIKKKKIIQKNTLVEQAINTDNPLDGGQLTIENRKSHVNNNLPQKEEFGSNNVENLEPDNKKKKNLENAIEIYPNIIINRKKLDKKFKILIAVLSIIIALFLIVFLPYYFLVIKNNGPKGGTEKKEENQNNEEKDEENSKEIVKINEELKKEAL